MNKKGRGEENRGIDIGEDNERSTVEPIVGLDELETGPSFGLMIGPILITMHIQKIRK